MSTAVITFPGSNCDRDCVHVLARVVDADVVNVWHKDTELPAGVTGLILPGGFSYGDALRAGAMAAHSPIMGAVKRFAEAGGGVLGICNGFQMLCEVGLLPGALTRNRGGTFVCETVSLDVETGERGLLRDYKAGERIQLPVAHGEGNYFAGDDAIAALEAGEGAQVAFRYADRTEDGRAALNGSRRAIAGLLGGPKDNIVGLMPHPERRSEPRLGGVDGVGLMRALARFGQEAA